MDSQCLTISGGEINHSRCVLPVPVGGTTRQEKQRPSLLLPVRLPCRVTCAHLNPMPYEAAAQMENDLADDLRREGYTVTGGH